MRFSSTLLLLLCFASGCGWATALRDHDDGSAPSDFGPGHDFGVLPDGGRPDFGILPDGGLPDFGLDFGPHLCGSDTECSDGLVCDGVERCIGGVCTPSMAPFCDDGIDCTDDACREPGGCTSVPNSMHCPFGQICRAGTGCVEVRCMTSLDCADGIFCNGAESCDPSTGLCVSGPPPCGPPGPCGPTCSEASHTCAMVAPDADGDGHASTSCGGDDCNDSDPRVHPGAVENCSDGVDDDCNGLVDCADPFCSGMPGCGCVPRPEDCTNGVDDDCNGLVDCNDMSCIASGACSECVDIELGSAVGRNVWTGNNIGAPMRTTGSCGGTTAGADRTFRWTAPTSGNYVFDTIGSTYDTVLYILSGCGGMQIACDDDGAGVASTSLIRLSMTAGETVIIVVDTWGTGIGSTGTYYLSITLSTSSEYPFCNDGLDNDGDGAIDCADSDCATYPTCSFDAGPPRDGGRPDGGRPDGGIVDSGPPPFDGSFDSGPCVATSMHENSIAMCTNGRDDNCDTRIDCADPECSPFGPMGECCNGIDDNHDGQVDEFTCRCFSNADCIGVGSLSQVCWTTTFSVCAPNCNFYGGTIGFCRAFFGASSTCNASTGECDGAVLGGGGGRDAG